MKMETETRKTLVLDKEDMEVLTDTIEAYNSLSDENKANDCGFRIIELFDEKDKPFNLRLEFKYIVGEGE